MAATMGVEKRWTTVILFLTLIVGPLLGVNALYLQGTDSSYARYPKWNACMNASLSFEFKVNRDQRDALLMYTDDGGRYDFIRVTLSSGRVHLDLNVVDGRDGRIRIEGGRDLHDGRWHKVEIIRKRMETTLIVDDLPPTSKFAFGSDFNFGELYKNSDVFFGGLPNHYKQDLHALSLPSVLYEHPRFKGSLRNVIYGNCTCQRIRADFINGEGAVSQPQEQCERRNPCRSGCLCVSQDTQAECDCSELQCVTGAVTHYHLPMDRMFGNLLDNPSGLDASAEGNPEQLRRGIENNAIRLKAPNQYLKATGPGHRYECFGDLEKCPMGYTLAFWMNFENPAEGETVYLSNGGHAQDNHGVALTYNKGNLEFRFRRKDGTEWRLKNDDVLPGRWYHIAATWGPQTGASLYINGVLVDNTVSPVSGRAANPNNQYNNFLIGRPNDNSQIRNTGSILVDEMHFWSMFKTGTEIRELGPFFHYSLPCDVMRGGEFSDTSVQHKIEGNPSLVDGKVGKALRLDGRRDYLDLGDHSNTCLGDLDLCLYGVTVVMWIKFDSLLENTYYLSSGNKGFNLFYKNGRLIADFQKGDNFWQADWAGVERNKWYFMELSWHPTDGLRMFVNQDQVGHASSYEPREITPGASNLYVGRANTDMYRERYASATVDELEFWYGDRNRLILFDFLQRGRPTMFLFNMDAVSDSGVRLVHPDLVLSLHGNPELVDGKIGSALELNGGGKYANLGQHKDECLGNLDQCRHGLLLASWFKPGKMSGKAEIMSSGANGLKVWYEYGQIKASFRTTTREWNLSYSGLPEGFWYFLEFSWDPIRGLSMHVNDQLVAHTFRPQVRRHRDQETTKEMDTFYLGRGDDTMQPGDFANMTIDELEYWYGNRQYLLAHGYIHRGKPIKYYFNMDEIKGNRLTHPDLVIPVHGNPTNVPGKHGNAVFLDGSGQYIDIGQHLDTCLGNLEYCRHGITGSMWTNFKRFEDNAYLLSTGDTGINIFYKDDKLYFVFELGDQRWEVPVSGLSRNRWYFFEYSWHPETGLKVFVDNQQVGSSSGRTVAEKPDTGRSSHVFVGRANPGATPGDRFKYVDAVVDEFETWFARREDLIANNYILRDNIPHIIMPFEAAQGNIVVHPDFRIVLHDQARLTSAKIGNGITMDGRNDYATIGDQRDKCLGNLEKCPQGMTMSFFTYPRGPLRDNTYYVSSGPYQVYYKDGHLVIEFSTATKTWTLKTQDFEADTWQKLDISWDEDGGLQLYVDGEQVSATTDYVTHPERHVTDHHVYLGRPNTQRTGRNANMIIDELQYWYAPRNVLVQRGLLDGDVTKFIVDMNTIRGNILVHPTSKIYVYGYPRTVPGPNENAVYLSGRKQYIDIGSNMTCNGNLENCPKGFTLRFKIKPNELRENMYFISSAPIDMYFKNGKLVADVRTPTKKWTVSSPSLDTQAWHQVDLSWDPIDGVKLYIDSERVSHTLSPVPNRIYSYGDRFYIGRSNEDMTGKYYGNIIIDDLQLWNAKRDILTGWGLIDDSGQPTGPTTTPAPTTPSVPPTRPTPVPTPPQTRNETMFIFNGRDWVTYDFSKLPPGFISENDYEQFLIQFKTNQPSGMIWFSGNQEKNMHLSLKNGMLQLVVDYGDGKIEKFLVSGINGARLNNGEWHDVRIIRNGRQITMDVDGVSSNPFITDGAKMITDGYFIVGGYDDPSAITNNLVRDKFNGRIRKIILQGDGMRDDLNLLSLFNQSPRPSYIKLNGLMGVAAGTGNGVTFTRREAYLTLNKWNARRSGTIEFKFRTVEPHNLLLFNGGQPGYSDFMAVEMFDGYLYFVIDFGSGVLRYPFSNYPLNDGQVHHIIIRRNHQNLVLTIDGQEQRYVLGGTDHTLDLGTFLYIGGVSDPKILPWQLWTRNPKFFVGCIWDLTINNGEITNLPQVAQQQRKVWVQPGCAAMDLQCASAPCVHGTCIDKWQKYICDCSGTVYNGRNCHLDAPKVAFNGRDFVKIRLSPMMTTHTNDISLRFTTKKGNGLLFSTKNSYSADFLRALLEDGKVKIQTNIGGELESVLVGDNLNDDTWHTLYIKRRANYLEAWVDEGEGVQLDIPGNGYTLDFDQVLVAAAGKHSSQSDNFVGYMQNFFFDHHDFFQYLQGGLLPPDINIEVKPGTPHLPEFDVTFKSHYGAYVQLERLDFGTGRAVDLSFMFKTTNADGLLVYQSGYGDDFFAIELVRGGIQLILNDGTQEYVQRANIDGVLNDGKWHIVELKRDASGKFSIKVDGTETSVDNTRPFDRFNFRGNLYIGGVERYGSLPEGIVSEKGFQGCLASLRINTRMYDLINDAKSITDLVSSGCTDEVVDHKLCPQNMCQHYGVCIVSPGGPGYWCNCNMTGWAGTVCTDEPEGYRYGYLWDKAVVVYEYDDPVDTSRDELAFGFMTNYTNGTMVRIDSMDSNDYIIASLVNGYVNVTYYMGTVGKEPFTLLETARNFSDSRYHTVRFIREGPKATMWVDSFAPHEQQSRDTIRLFNEQKVIKVGGNIDEESRIFNYFDGILAGVYFNGIRVIDSALGHDYHVTVYGEDYKYADHPFRLTKGPRPTLPPTEPPPVTDAPVKTEKPIIPSEGPGSPATLPPATPPPELPEVPDAVPPDYPGGGIAWETVPGGGGDGAGGAGGGDGAGGAGGGDGGAGGGGTGGGGDGTGVGGGPDGEVIRVDPGGGGGGAGIGPGSGSPPAGVIDPNIGAQVSGSGPAVLGAGEGARALVGAGTALGILLLGSSLMWALYKFKPGIIGGGGGVAKGGGSTPLQISSPRTTNYTVVKSVGGGAGMGYGSGTGTGTATGMGTGYAGGGTASSITKAEINGAAGFGSATMRSSAGTQTMDGGGVGGGAAGAAAGAAAAGGGASSAAFADYFSSVTHTQTAAGGGAGAMGTMNRGIQTEIATAPPPPAPAAYTDMSAQSRTMMYESSQTSGTMAGGGTMSSSSAMAQEVVQGGYGDGMAMGGAGGVAGGVAGAGAGGASMSSYKESKSFSSSMETYNAASSYQMQNMALSMGGMAGSNMAALAAGTTPNLMAAEEIRVDTVLMSSDGRYVITGSIYGPPQVWDLHTGDLVKVTQGEDFSSTDLHLACNDTLLVGQVAEMTQIDPNDPQATSRIHHRKLQIWDFESGKPLEMNRNELCTASCMMNDGERIVLGRTEKFGGGTTIVIWDIPGNEAVRKLHYDGSVGFADYISYLNLSRDNRYVVAGFQNSYDGNANFIIFDLTRDNYNVIEPKILALDATAECTAILANHEAVTGTRKGELTIWSMRTGKPLRQLVSSGPGSGTMGRVGSPTSGSAHTREVKALAMSENGKTLVSASADGSLKVWDMDTEKQKFTIKGHTDEVLCCALSADGEILVSGSKDNTIRLWRMSNGSLICAYNTGVDIFSVKISNNKKTIVALGDQFGARKLIMLKIVISKIKSRNPSRATSPQGRPISP